MTTNPIAALLGLTPAADKVTLRIGSEDFELYPARGDTVETMYRVNPGHGVSNPGYSLHLTPATHHAMALGQYLSRPRDGVKRAQAEALVATARVSITA